MDLDLILRAGPLTVAILNSSAQERRLWEWQNSWGWYSLAVQVRGAADQQIEIKRRWRDWTKNGPVYFVVPPRGSRDVSIDLQDGWWEAADAIFPNWLPASWKDHPVELRARLRIEPTPESERFDVFTGTVFSEWIVSRPPHGWLPVEG